MDEFKSILHSWIKVRFEKEFFKVNYFFFYSQLGTLVHKLSTVAVFYFIISIRADFSDPVQEFLDTSEIALS